MRLDYVRIQGFKNLQDVEVDFDPSEMTTVIIGLNGTGKSNLIEAIARIFRDIDLGKETLFGYRVRYQIRTRTVELSKAPGERAVAALVDGVSTRWSEFTRSDPSLLPGMVFGYYSGSSRRLEEAFDDHHERYYKTIINEGKAGLRRFFYCRPSYGQLALLATFASAIHEKGEFLRKYLGITDFESALIVLKKPSWKSKRAKGDPRFWNAAGLVRDFLQHAFSIALAPIRAKERYVDDYRRQSKFEERLYLFIPDLKNLKLLAEISGGEKAFFQHLESAEISDLVREVRVWAKRENANEEIPFHEVSDGERQLMTVLGLLRYAREEESLFLLDEPDTHLNPAWQLQYLDIIGEWVGNDYRENSHLIITTHDPLTMASLEREQVQVMYRDDVGAVRASQARTSPKGLGFTGILTEIFGLPTTVDLSTQELLDERNSILLKELASEEDEKRLIALNQELSALGFLFENREPQYSLFLRAWDSFEKESETTLSPEQIFRKNLIAEQIIADIFSKDEQ